MLIVALVVAVLLFLTGVPLYLAFGLGGGIILLYYCDVPLYNLAMMFFESINNFTLLAVPLFILAGNIMVHSGMGKDLVSFLSSFVGRIPGGLAVSTIIAMAFVGALTGTAMATLPMVGLIMFPAMLAASYTKGYSGGVLLSSANLGNLIPPSVTFILFGYLTQTSVGKLFMAGIMPGLMVAALLSVTAILIAKRKQFPLMPSVSWRERKGLFIKSIPGLIMPVIILGGIYTGIFTPTEAAAVACIYAFLISIFVYRRLTWKDMWVSLTDTVRILGFMFVILAGILVFGKAFMIVGLPRAVADWVLAANLGATGFLLLLAAGFVALGFIMDMMPMLIILPLIMPAAMALDISYLHLGVMFVVSVEIGIMTPPAAQFLYITAGMFDIPVDELIRGVLPFIGTMIIALAIVCFFPVISTWLPSMMVAG